MNDAESVPNGFSSMRYENKKNGNLSPRLQSPTLC